ncbi:MAG: glycosyltransferase [Ktedonobacteraceae bacterium]
MTTRPIRHTIPPDILALSHERDELRKRGQYSRADALKKLIEDAGYSIKDNPRGAHLVILPSIEVDGTIYRIARQVPSLLNESDRCLLSVQILANNCLEEARRCVESVLHHAGDQAIEVMLIDNASQDELASWAKAYQQETALLHFIRTSRVMGEAAARNLGLQQSQGRFILQLAPNLELTGDIFTPLAQVLENAEVGITGPRGLHTDDLRHFEESADDEAEAIDGSCMAFPRKLLKKTGLFDEGYRFPASYMDIDFSLAVRDRGLQARVARDLPLISHPTQSHSPLSDEERTRLNKRNFYHFLDNWGDREDLLLNGVEDDEEEYEDDEDEE